MADFRLAAGDRLPAIASTITDGRPVPGHPFGMPIDLTGAAVAFRMRALDGTVALLDAAATVVDAELGEVAYEWAAGDTATPGAYLAEWQITFADGRRLTVPNGTPITIDTAAGVADSTPIRSGDLRSIRAHIGSTIPPTDAELAEALARLGRPEAVALEVLEARYADLIARPAQWTVEGDFSLDASKNIEQLSAKVAELRADLRTGPTLTAFSITRADRTR